MAFEKFEIATISTAIGIVAFLGLGVYLSTPSGEVLTSGNVEAKELGQEEKISVDDLNGVQFFYRDLKIESILAADNFAPQNGVNCSDVAEGYSARAEIMRAREDIPAWKKYSFVSFTTYTSTFAEQGYITQLRSVNWQPIYSDNRVEERVTIGVGQPAKLLGDDWLPIKDPSKKYSFIYVRYDINLVLVLSRHDGYLTTSESAFIIDGKLSSDMAKVVPFEAIPDDSVFACVGEVPNNLPSVNASQ